MARTAAERRAARKRKDQRRGRPAGGPSAGSSRDRESAIRQLIADAIYTGSELHLDRTAATLARLDGALEEHDLLTGLLVGLVRGLWERGWQPADVVHVVRRATTARATRLAVAVIGEDARVTGAATRAPEPWLAQLEAMGATGGPSPDAVGTPTPSDVVATWWQTEGLDPVDAWRHVLRLFHALTGLGELPHLLPPPARWEARRRAARAPAGAVDARVLGRIRGLLAKAESTDFPEEAEALSAKAQELMTRHAVDAALLEAGHGVTAGTDEIGARRVHIDNPYPEGKVRLLDAVGTANDVRVVWMEQFGMATTVGRPADLAAVELLYTSLLVQAGRAMAATGRGGTSRARTPSFRRAFLIAYAQRIGERLEEVRATVTGNAARSTGADLIPLLRARSEAVDEAFAAMFPRTYARESRTVDARGWYAGRRAADDAVLESGRSPVTG